MLNARVRVSGIGHWTNWTGQLAGKCCTANTQSNWNWEWRWGALGIIIYIIDAMKFHLRSIFLLTIYTILAPNWYTFFQRYCVSSRWFVNDKQEMEAEAGSKTSKFPLVIVETIFNFSTKPVNPYGWLVRVLVLTFFFLSLSRFSSVVNTYIWYINKFVS